MNAAKPEIKKYLNVHKYLQDYYEFRKSSNSDFSYEVWSREIGLKSRTYLRLLVFATRPINEPTAELLRKSLDLSSEDGAYFICLVHYTQSRTEEQRRVFGLQLSRYLTPNVDFHEVQQSFEFVANPLLPVLQTLLTFEDVIKTPASLSNILNVAEEQIVEGLKNLEGIGLAKKEEETKEWASVSSSWRVPQNLKDLGLGEFYRNTLKKAEQSLHLPGEERRFRSLFVALSKDEYGDLLKDFEVFIQEQLKKRNVNEIENRRLYQLNFNLFPESKLMKTSTNELKSK